MRDFLRLLRTICVLRETYLFLTLAIGLLLWGEHGRMSWLSLFDPNWTGMGHFRRISPSNHLEQTWNQDLICFIGGVILLVVCPAFVIRGVLRAKPSDFGLGMPALANMPRMLQHSLLIAMVAFPAFFLASFRSDIRSTYPYYVTDPRSFDFAAFEFATILFYVVIEVVFRGYILFGIERVVSTTSTADNMTPSAIAVIVAVLPYVCWHLGKPFTELAGTILWGIVAGASTLTTRTIWHVVILHWMFNIFMDYWILINVGAGN
ncbi:CPBP family intramembrane glutamic endopeptidase [Rhizobium ruizarguesonis]